MSARRGGERGLSIIEAIVIATITALLALLILPLLPRASAGSLSVAERGVDAQDEARAEQAFRHLVRSVSQRDIDGQLHPIIEGNESGLIMQVDLAEPVACAAPGAPSVRLMIERSGLVCASEGRNRRLLRWPAEGAGRLAYSADGVSWTTRWTRTEVAPYVRLEQRQRGRLRAVWVERVTGAAS